MRTELAGYGFSAFTLPLEVLLMNLLDVRLEFEICLEEFGARWTPLPLTFYNAEIKISKIIRNKLDK